MLSNEQIIAAVIDAIEDVKGGDIRTIDVAGKSSVSDTLIIASGNTARQVKAIAGNVVEKIKHAGVQPLGVEGEQHAEWVLVDLGDIVVHIMQPSIRDFYNLEKLWGDDSPAVVKDAALE